MLRIYFNSIIGKEITICHIYYTSIGGQICHEIVINDSKTSC